MPTTRIDSDVPGLVFTPRDHDGSLPLVLLGHGAHTGKDDAMMQALARGIARGVPAAVLCIDAPGHGELRPEGLDDAAFDEHVHEAMADPTVVEQYFANWRDAIAAARRTVPTIDDRLGYAGFSMGAMYGCMFAGRIPGLGPVLLAIGGQLSPDTERNRATNDLIRAGAPHLHGHEVLMINMTRDEFFSMDGALELFALIDAPKRMHVYEGGHTDIGAEALAQAIEFLRTNLPETRAS